MVSEWEQATLGSLFAVDNSKLGPHAEEPIVMSLSKYDGFVRADEYFEKRIASSKLDGYKIVEPGEWAFSTIHIDEGSIARNNRGERGVISPMYTTMRFVATDCIPEFAELLVRQPSILAEYSRRAQGSVNRRRSLPFRAFAEISVALPASVEQRRIVDVIAAVDVQIEALAEEIAEGMHVLSALRTETPRSVEVPIGSVLDGIDSGKSVQTKGETPMPGEARVLKLSAVQLGYFDAQEAKRLDDSSAYAATHLVRDGDLLITRSNTPERVGYVAVACDVPPDTYLPDLIWRIRTDRSRCLASYLGHVLCAPEFRARITASAAGTSKSMQKINKKNFGAIKVPVPRRIADQERYVSNCDALLSTVGVARKELSRLRAFRGALLSALLNQEIQIPESYDALLEEVA